MAVNAQYLKEPEESDYFVDPEYIKEPEESTEDESQSFVIPDLTLGFIPQPTISQRQTFPREPELKSGKNERSGLLKPVGVQARIEQAKYFKSAEEFRKHEQALIRELQAKIDRGEKVDPLQVAFYQDYLDIPEPEIKAQVLAGAVKQPEERQIMTAQGWMPASQVTEPITAEPEKQPEMPLGSAIPPEVANNALPPEQLPTLESGGMQIESPGSWSGILKRPFESMGSALGQSVASIAQGIIDLNQRIPTPQFIKNLKEKIGSQEIEDKAKAKLDNLVTDLGLYRKQIGNEIRKEGGIAAEVAQSIADGAAETALMLAGAGVLKPLKSASALRQSMKEAARFGAIMAAGTPGTAEDRTRAGITSAAYMMTPLAATRLGSNPAMTGVINTLLNAGVDAVSGNWSNAIDEAQRRAEEQGQPGNWKRELLITLSPMILNEGLFGVMGEMSKLSEAQKTQVKEGMKDLPPEVIDNIQKVNPKEYAKWQEIVATEGELPKAEEVVTKPDESLIKEPEEVQNAITQGKVEEGNQPEYIGVTRREDIPTYEGEVREGEGERASDSGGDVGGRTEPKGQEPEVGTEQAVREVTQTTEMGAKKPEEMAKEIRNALSKIEIEDDITISAKDRNNEAGFSWNGTQPEFLMLEKKGFIKRNLYPDDLPQLTEKGLNELGYVLEGDRYVYKPTTTLPMPGERQTKTPTVNSVEVEVLKKSGIPKEQIPNYIQDTVANGAKLRKEADAIIAGEKTIDDAAKVVAEDWKQKNQESNITESSTTPDVKPQEVKEPEEVLAEESVTSTPDKPLSLEESVMRGEKIKIPKGATFIRITDLKGRQAIVSTKDIDTLKGVDIKNVEFGVKGKQGFVAMKQPTALSDKDLIVKPLKDLQEVARERGIDVSEKGRKEIVDEIKTEQNIEKTDQLLEEMPVPEEMKRKRGLRNRMGAIGFEKDIRLKANITETDARKVEQMFQKQQSDIQEKFKLTGEKIRNAVSSAVFGADIPITRKLMENGGKDVAIAKALSRGWSSKADVNFNEAESYIKETIPQRLDRLFDDVLQAHRTIEVSNLMRENRGVQPELFAEGELPEVISSPGGLGAKENRAWLDEVKRQFPNEYNAIETARGRWNETMRKQIDKMLDAGLIDKQYHDYLAKNHPNFSPRRFLHHIDPTMEINAGGRKITVRDSGLDALDTGSEKSLINNSTYLLAQTISSVESRIAKNEANKELLKYVEANKENPLGLKLETEAMTKEKIPSGFTRISVMINGKPKTMIGPNDIMKYWAENDPQLKLQTTKVLQTLSGVKVVKALATGYNPEFALYNLPRDLFHYWFVTQEYSKALPLAWGQQVNDILSVLPDVVRRKGRVQDYINEGGGMTFLSTSGQLGRKPSAYATVRNETLNQISKFAGWLGETSELLTRIALRERAIKNGKSNKEATYIARTALDFSQGGTFVKTLDHFIPYLNAGMQGTRNVIDTLKNRPGEAMIKAAQLIGLGATIELFNQYTNQEADDSVPDAEKVSKFIITLPFFKKDKNGDKRHFYIPIPKDQGQQIFSIIGQELMHKYLTGKYSAKRIKMALGNFFPADIQTFLPPTLSALLGYVANKDFWQNEDIWKGRTVDPQFEKYATTPAAWSKIGEMTGLSPERLRRSVTKVAPNNPFSYIMGGLQSPMAMAEDDAVTEKLLTLMSKLPFVRRYMKTTFATDLNEDDIKKAEKLNIPLNYDNGAPRPRNKVKEEINDRTIKQNNFRQLNDIHLDLLAGQLKKKEVEEDVVWDWIDSLDSDEGKRITQRFKNKYGKLTR